MRSDSVKAGELLRKIASAVRRRRLEEVHRMRNFCTSMDDESYKHGVDSRIPSGGCRKKRRAVIELASPDNTPPVVKMSKVDISGLTAEMASSGSSSSSQTSPVSGGCPVGIQVSGGEFSGEGELGSLTYVSHGSISVIGRRRAMEDAVTVAPGVLAGEFESTYDFFAVYDGHGGSSVSQACRDRMHQLLAMEVEGWTRGSNGGGGGGERDWEKVMSACFKKMDDEVNCGGGHEGAGSSSSSRSTSTAMIGSTAVVVVVGMKEIVVANCGDSRAVLCRGDVPVPLSRDHKPDRPDERERVEAAGGKVINWNGCRVLGVLATSRSIGDQYLKPYVISDPEVTVNERTKSDSFIIVASDGIWDVLSNEVACEVVRRCLVGQVKRRFAEELNGSYSMEAAAMLAELAMARGSKDNISVIVVELKKLSESTS